MQTDGEKKSFIISFFIFRWINKAVTAGKKVEYFTSETQ